MDRLWSFSDTELVERNFVWLDNQRKPSLMFMTFGKWPLKVIWNEIMTALAVVLADELFNDATLDFLTSNNDSDFIKRPFVQGWWCASLKNSSRNWLL